MSIVPVPTTTLVEDVEGECPACGFDALLRARGFALSEHGVTTIFQKTYCGRCVVEERRSREP